jgi:hypothetical protein
MQKILHQEQFECRKKMLYRISKCADPMLLLYERVLIMSRPFTGAKTVEFPFMADGEMSTDLKMVFLN